MCRTTKMIPEFSSAAHRKPVNPIESAYYNGNDPWAGHTTNVSSATHPGHPEKTQDESGRYEAENGRMSRSTNRPRPTGPEICLRIVHAALPRENDAPLATYREQEVVVALGPMGIVEDGQVGKLTRRIEANQVVRVVPPTRGNLKPPTYPKTPRVTELLRKAIEWQQLLDIGEVRNRADIARREGITRPRVTQVMGMLRLAPEIQEKIQSLAATVTRSPVTERVLRPIATCVDYRDQLHKFHQLFV
jgi:hypothetical protein